MSGNEFEDRETEDGTKVTPPGTASGQEPTAEEPARTEQIEAERPAPTRFFEVPGEIRSFEAEAEAEAVERIDWTDPPASLDPPDPIDPTDPADPVDPVDPVDQAEPNPLDLPAAPVFTPEPSFRPENESLSPEPGFVGYITKKRGPQTPPSSGGTQPEFTPAGPPQTSPVQPVIPQTEPGIRSRTVIIGLILLAVGLSALLTQLGGISLNPEAVVFTVMLAAGVTLMSAALKRDKTPR